MKHLAALAVCLAQPAWAEPVLPSGLVAQPHDALVEVQPGGETWLVLRYLAPAIAGGAVSFDAVLPDLDHLCVTEGLGKAASLDPAASEIVIVLMDRPVPRGEIIPEATQFIGSYQPVEGECLWE